MQGEMWILKCHESIFIEGVVNKIRMGDMQQFRVTV